MSTPAGIQALAQRLQMSERGLHDIVLGCRVPQLETLLRICYCLGTTPLQLLAHRATHTDTMPRGTLLHEPNFHYRSHKPFDSDYVQRSLNQMISKNEMPPPSMAEVARQLGYDQSNLSERFPELCRAKCLDLRPGYGFNVGQVMVSVTRSYNHPGLSCLSYRDYVSPASSAVAIGHCVDGVIRAAAGAYQSHHPVSLANIRTK